MSESKGWSSYILECADGSYYVGLATDLRKRVKVHNTWRAATVPTLGPAPAAAITDNHQQCYSLL